MVAGFSPRASTYRRTIAYPVAGLVDTRSIMLADGHTISVPVGGQGNAQVYGSLIASHYWSVIVLTFTDTVVLDDAIAKDLQENHGYRIAATIPFGPTRHGNYTVWVYR